MTTTNSSSLSSVIRQRMCAGHQQHPSITVLFQRARVAVQVQIQNIQKEKEGERKPPPPSPFEKFKFWRCCLQHSGSIGDQELRLRKKKMGDRGPLGPPLNPPVRLFIWRK